VTGGDEHEPRIRRLRELGIDVVTEPGVCAVRHRHGGTIVAHVSDPDAGVARARALAHAERALELDPIDAALAETLPASDPPSTSQPGIT
jgi:hypothetical protein